MEKNKEEFLKFVQAYGLMDTVFEIRILKGFRGIMSGYFNSVDKAYEEISHIWKEYTCYFSLQKIDENLLARAENKLKEYVKQTTSNNDVEYYKFLHIDVDPKRLAGIQSTKEESEYGRNTIIQVRRFLEGEFGFSKPIFTFSGNGYTADYYLDNIPNTANNQKLITGVLECLDILFSNEKADIDTSVANPARIIKIPGTISKKGDSTEDRPYRYSQIISVPENVISVTLDQLKEINSIKEALGNEKG